MGLRSVFLSPRTLLRGAPVQSRDEWKLDYEDFPVQCQGKGMSGVFREREAEGDVVSPSGSSGQLKRSFILPSRLRDVGLLSICMVSPSWRSKSRCGLVSFFGVFTTTCTTRSPRPCSFR
jgi:hypothetical protein